MRKANVLKLCLLGDGGVGKTTLSKRILTGIFNPATKMTIGIDFELLKVDILDPFSDDPQKINLDVQIWDFGGQQHFRFMQPRFVNGAAGGLLLYDVARESTQNYLGEWLKIWHENSEPNTPIYLIGAKEDTLNTGAKNITLNRMEELKREYGIEKSFLISSKSGYSIDIMLDNILKDMYIFNKKWVEKAN